jgi:HEAT repeat protein
MELPTDMQLNFVFGVFGTSSLPFLREALRSPERNIRRNAAVLAGVFFDDLAAPALRELLNDSEPEVRAMAARSLGVSGLPGDVETLGKLLATDAVPEVRFNAAFALYEIASPTAVPHLLAGLADSEARIRNECAAGLGYYHDDAALGGLVRRLPLEPEEQIRASILETLGAAGTLAHATELGSLVKSGALPAGEEVQATIARMRERGAKIPLPFPWPALPDQKIASKKI